MSTSSSERELLELDLYQLLDPSSSLSASSTPTDISRHYRKQARLLHPDKNPNNPKAAEQFDTLQRAYELLTDEAKRAQYDDRRRAREEKRRRAAEEDVRVRLMRERLEERERAAKVGWESNKRQMQAARIQRENEAVIQQLRQPQPKPLQRTERAREESKQEEVEQNGHESGASNNVGTREANAELDIAAYEASTLEKMRNMARKRKEEREKQQHNANGHSAYTSDTKHNIRQPGQASSQRESEVIVLDDAGGDNT